MPSVKDLLSNLELGKSVAEFDDDLEKYFVETNTFKELVKDKFDIVAGDKGTGKTAIFKIIQKRHQDYRELDGVNIVPAFNPTGSPVFSSLTEKEALEEGEYILLWKSYILAVIGNWLIRNCSRPQQKHLDELKQLLEALDLLTTDVSPKGVLQKILESLPNFFIWKSAEVEISATSEGIPTITPRVNFGQPQDKFEEVRISVEDAFSILDNTLGKIGAKVWLAFDRLDEAFQGYPDIEIKALRALLRSYLDTHEFRNFKLKLFLRRDLFRRITLGGFVNLTHVNDKKLEIIWDEEDLLHLLCRRIRENPGFLKSIEAEGKTDEELFDVMFPDQVDVGERKPKTWTWIMGRIRDGNDVKPPRNLIDLVKNAQLAQLRKEEREKREFDGSPLIESEAIRRGLSQLSETRVNDTLLAEAGIFSPLIERFRDSKSEHNNNSLAELLEIDKEAVRREVKPLVELGFLEEVGSTYKIPMLYRDGLDVTQGKAF